MVAPDAGLPDGGAVGAVATPDGGHPVPDAGHWMGTVVQPDANVTGIVAQPDGGVPRTGLMVTPDGGQLPIPGIMVSPDSGVVPGDAGARDGGVKDASCSFLNGIVIIPPDASCTPYYPGVTPRD